MMFNRAESKAGNKKDRIVDDFDFIADFVKEGLHIQATTIESVDRNLNTDTCPTLPLSPEDW